MTDVAAVQYAELKEPSLTCVDKNTTAKCNILTGYSECVCNNGSEGCSGKWTFRLYNYH